MCGSAVFVNIESETEKYLYIILLHVDSQLRIDTLRNIYLVFNWRQHSWTENMVSNDILLLFHWSTAPVIYRYLTDVFALVSRNFNLYKNVFFELPVPLDMLMYETNFDTLESHLTFFCQINTGGIYNLCSWKRCVVLGTRVKTKSPLLNGYSNNNVLISFVFTVWAPVFTFVCVTIHSCFCCKVTMFFCLRK